MIAAIPLEAMATSVWYYAGGLAATDADAQILAYGVQGDSYMYAKQSAQDADWVNSLYARQDDGDFFEAGWYWTPGSTSRQWFCKLRQGGVYYPETWFTVSNAPNGDRARLQIRRSGTSGDTYLVLVDGVLKRTEYSTGIGSCRASVGAERYETADTNYGSWTYIKYLRSDNTWAYWTNALRNAGGNADPTYRVYTNNIDNSNHEIYVNKAQR